MAIVKRIEDLNKVITVQGDFDFTQIAPYVPEVEEEHIVSIIGDALYAELNEDKVHPAVMAALIDQIALPVCTLSVLNALPALNVGFSASGLTVSKGEHHAPASQTRTEDLKRSLLDLGHKRIDGLLRYIERNKTAINEAEGYASIDQTELLGMRSFILPNALAFNEYYDINKSRYLFVKMLPTLRNIESTVLPELIGSDFYQELKTAAASSGGLSDKQKLLLPYLQDYLANKTFSDSLVRLRMNVDDRGLTIFNNNYAETVNVATPALPNDVKMLRDDADSNATNAIDRLLKFLNTNANDYTTFKDSDKYVAPVDGAAGGSLGVVSGEGYTGFL